MGLQLSRTGASYQTTTHAASVLQRSNLGYFNTTAMSMTCEYSLQLVHIHISLGQFGWWTDGLSTMIKANVVQCRLHSRTRARTTLHAVKVNLWPYHNEPAGSGKLCSSVRMQSACRHLRSWVNSKLNTPWPSLLARWVLQVKLLHHWPSPTKTTSKAKLTRN